MSSFGKVSDFFLRKFCSKKAFLTGKLDDILSMIFFPRFRPSPTRRDCLASRPCGWRSPTSTSWTSCWPPPCPPRPLAAPAGGQDQGVTPTCLTSTLSDTSPTPAFTPCSRVAVLQTMTSNAQHSPRPRYKHTYHKIHIKMDRILIYFSCSLRLFYQTE